MSINSQKQRQNYSQISNRIHSNKFDRKLYSQVKDSRVEAERLREHMVNNQQYAYLEECNDHIEKYAKMEKLIQAQIDGKINSNQLVTKSKLLFPTTQTTSQLNKNNINDSITSGRANQPPITRGTDSVKRNVSPQSIALNSFFDKKASEIKPASTLKSVLQTPSISSQNFRKKPKIDKIQLQSLIKQNNQLKYQIESLNNRNQDSSRLQNQYRLNKQQIQVLQREYNKLSRDNFQLRSERSATMYSTSNNDDDDPMYSPYIMSFRKNDIYSINARNMFNEGLGDSISNHSQDVPVDLQPPIVVPPVVTSHPQPEPHKHILYKKIQYEYQNYTEDDYAKQKDLNFSIFDVNKSYLSESGLPNEAEKSRIGIENSRTALRNKMAFFKPKGIIVRNTDIEIGYKKSEPENNMVRVILYFNNKNADYKTIRTDYKYEQDYYQLRVTEKIRELDSFRQGREVVEVKLRGPQDNFNSVIEVVVYVGSDVYNLWLPAMFVMIRPNGFESRGQIVSKSIYPARIFSGPNETKKIIQNLKILNNNEAQFWCQTSKGTGKTHLLWKLDKNKLTITCNEKWLHLISFLMIDN